MSGDVEIKIKFAGLSEGYTVSVYCSDLARLLQSRPVELVTFAVIETTKRTAMKIEVKP